MYRTLSLLAVCLLPVWGMPQTFNGNARSFNRIAEEVQNRDRPSARQETQTLPTKVLETKGDYRVVQTPASKWICAQDTVGIDYDPYGDWQTRFKGDALAALGANQDTIASKMFKKLFAYITGVNKASAAIKMTAPVTSRIELQPDGSHTEEMCFWLGADYSTKDAPEPIEPTIYVQERDVMKLFVRRFGGWALSNDDWESQLIQMSKSLADRPDAKDNGVFYSVGYDSPFVRSNDRTNEIWVPVTPPPAEDDTPVEPTVVVDEAPAAPVAAAAAAVEEEDDDDEDDNEELPYKVLSTTADYELREYGPQRWVCTQANDVVPSEDPYKNWESKYNNDPYKAMQANKGKGKTPANKMFMKLFAYILGVNVDGQEIDMTIPVPTQHDPQGEDLENQRMCFWLGSEYSTGDELPPAPLKKDVQVLEKPGFQVYVHEFGGYALSHDDYYVPYQALKEKLMKEGNEIDESKWLHCSYNSPFDQGPRRNEVWIGKKL